ncbi:MAG: hypothetical protein KGI60_04895 [Patescibacteria group bacterium]|nr:hypothetical protein [Patescibacteria group bacterium]
MTTIFILSLAGAVISAAVGTFWYSNKTPMGRLHMTYLGFDKLSPEEQQQKIALGKSMMGKMYAGQLALSFLTSFATVFIIVESVRNQVPFLLAAGFVVFNWLCFMVPSVGGQVLWGNVDRSIAWKKFFSDITSSLITLLLIALMTSFFV